MLNWGGYTKNMQILNFSDKFRYQWASNLLHNRLNLKWSHSSKCRTAIELRNRMMWGDQVRLSGNLNQLWRNQKELLKLSVLWFQSNTVVLHTQVDRLWTEYSSERWNVRLGRQRINWAMCSSFNPNDLFNTYNFLDFDYEERPGIDGLKIKYHWGEWSQLELVLQPDSTVNEATAAMKYATNYNGFDMQFNSAYFGGRFSLGSGWAGRIGEIGFKGEIQYFSRMENQAQHLNLSLEWDYAFQDAWYGNLAFLINSEGRTGKLNTFENLEFNFNPLNLMPTKYNISLAISKTFNVLSTASLNILYGPGTNLLLILPSFRYNFSQNLDFDFVWQSFFIQRNTFEDLGHGSYLRMRWSF